MKNALTKNADMMSPRKLYSRHEDRSYTRHSSLSSNRRLYLHTMDSEKVLAEKLTLLIVEYFKYHGLPGYNESKTVDALTEPLQIEKNRVMEQYHLTKKRIKQELQGSLEFIWFIEGLIEKGSNNGDETHRDKNGGHGANNAHQNEVGGHGADNAHAFRYDNYPSPDSPNMRDGFLKTVKDKFHKPKVSSPIVQDRSRSEAHNGRGKPHRSGPGDGRHPTSEAHYPDLGPSVALASDGETCQSPKDTTTSQEEAFFSERIENSFPGTGSSQRAGAKRKIPKVQRGPSTPPDLDLRRSERPKRDVIYSK